MPTYRYDKTLGAFVDKRTGERMIPEGHVSEITLPFIMTDIPEYRSVVSGKMITSRSERREDLKRTGCREVDPSEYTPEYRNAKYERRYSKDAQKLARSR